jgi:hypothetical protein
MRFPIAALLLAYAAGGAGGADLDEPLALRADDRGWSRRDKAVALNLGMATVMSAYAVSMWDVGIRSWRIGDEGWFSRSSAHGGADKVGHAWTASASTSLFAAIYRQWDYSREDAAAMGAFSGYGLMTLVEIGDAMSARYGFSYEDQVMNTAGALLGYARERFPRVRSLIDFRVQYLPTARVRRGDDLDVFTDYSGSTYLLALKASGFPCLRDTWLRWFEIQGGYFARGFEEVAEGEPAVPGRNLYVGVGIDVGEILRAFAPPGFGAPFEHLQVPFTYLPLVRKLDR